MSALPIENRQQKEVSCVDFIHVSFDLLSGRTEEQKREGDSVDFIHVSFDLLSGRTEEQKRELSRQLMAACFFLSKVVSVVKHIGFGICVITWVFWVL